MWDAVCWSRKTLSYSVWALHAFCVSVRPQNGVLGVHHLGRQNDESWRVLSRDCRKNEGENSISLLQLLALCSDWCAVWRCLAGGHDSSSYLAEPFEFVVLTSLRSAHVALDSLWNISSRIPRTWFLHCPSGRWPAEVCTLNFFLAWRRLIMPFLLLSFRQ
jgi:hypothetical protein